MHTHTHTHAHMQTHDSAYYFPQKLYMNVCVFVCVCMFIQKYALTLDLSPQMNNLMGLWRLPVVFAHVCVCALMKFILYFKIACYDQLNSIEI